MCVVYRIPLSCQKVYVGQTGRCLNIRLYEHAGTMKNSTYANLPAHRKKCGCEPIFGDTEVFLEHRNQKVREIVEAFYINPYQDDCVSQTSITLHEKEKRSPYSRPYAHISRQPCCMCLFYDYLWFLAHYHVLSRTSHLWSLCACAHLHVFILCVSNKHPLRVAPALCVPLWPVILRLFLFSHDDLPTRLTFSVTSVK